MALNMNIDGMEIYLNIKGYQKTNSENWDDTWCNVDFAFRFQGCIDYSMNDAEILLACEVESLEKILTELLEDKLQQTKSLYSFIEPDFNFELFPKHKIIDEDPDVIYVKPGHEFIDVSADWIVNLWHDGALTANSFSVAMDRKDITQLRDYLRTILKGDTKINLFLFLHTIIWAIAGICLWSLVSIVILRDIGWMLTFAEYAAFFPGFIGGIMFLWSHDKK